jgi:transposase-like protein
MAEGISLSIPRSSPCITERSCWSEWARNSGTWRLGRSALVLVGMLRAYSNHVSAAQQLRGVIETAQEEANPPVPRPFTTQTKPRAKRLTSDEVADLRQQYLDGKQAFELAKQFFGIHPTTVTATLKRARVEIRQRGLTDEQIDEAVKLYAEGKSLYRIGDHCGVDHTTVWQQLKKRGVKMRDTHGRETYTGNPPGH